MSTVRTDTLQNAAGTKSVPVGTVVDGSAKAWVNFNGVGTIAIRGSFNVSSITDNGVGDYTVNFTSALADANYCVLCTGWAPANGYSVVQQHSGTAQTSSACRLASVVQSSGTPTANDRDQITAAFFR